MNEHNTSQSPETAATNLLCLRFMIVNILILLATSNTVWGQQLPQRGTIITREAAFIDADSSMWKVVLDQEAFTDKATDGGGSLTGFFRNGKVRKIVQWTGLSYGNEVMEFYFSNEQLIFVRERFHSFLENEKTGALDHSRTDETFTGRYYFHRRKLMDYETTGHNRFEDDTLDPEQVLLSEAAALLRLVKKAGAANTIKTTTF